MIAVDMLAGGGVHCSRYSSLGFDAELLSRFPANSARGVRSPDFIYLISAAGNLSVKLGLNNTRLLVPVQYYFILHQATIEQCRQQQDTSQTAMLADGVMAAEWPRRRVQWCSP